MEYPSPHTKERCIEPAILPILLTPQFRDGTTYSLATDDTYSSDIDSIFLVVGVLVELCLDHLMLNSACVWSGAIG